jgi:hypothetical protein
MDEVYINAKNFRSAELSEMFGKDLISIDELVEKIYELKDMLDELKLQSEELKEDLKYTNMELTSAKLGFSPNH